ncbi:helix-turn-helix domain-containing protein [Microbacterium capsulatum]|uniref:Helix-turn-helix domain-containing protein n=1 Tax=Microbacterium capsulatum TaxID=3041921 RepID=A0ABU0XBV0_9MICO|nr:helix-turn-helix domain-containing protein [Microbacterium sp. ASV81]MDQ4212588.1 helix-turn-helix domain-containing protein [Microbacterium sp. ASV81]
MDTPDHPVGMRLDERAVRVLAHPLRSRILSELRLHGPATATELAAALSTNTGATSYHLRALEDVGLVTDTEEGAGKRRIWRASTDHHSWTNSGFADDEDAQTALGWLRRDYVRQFAARAERWLDVEATWPAAWVDRLGLSDALLTVTPGQLADFQAELDALLVRYRRAGEGDPTARRVHLAMQSTPIDLDPPEQS